MLFYRAYNAALRRLHTARRSSGLCIHCAYPVVPRAQSSICSECGLSVTEAAPSITPPLSPVLRVFLLSIAAVAISLCFGSPRFSEAWLRGHSVDQVVHLFGDPDYDSRKNHGSASDFVLGYYYGYGVRYSIEFRDGTVARVSKSSR
jgi:ribosomal protein L37AE/L43A